MNSEPARLLVRYGPFPTPEYPLPQHTVTVGREPISDIVLSDAEISRRHARLTFQAGRYLIEDLGSTNGTFVNGRRIHEPTVLKPGDVIDFAEFVGFTFAAPTEELDKTLLEGMLPADQPQTVARFRAPAAPHEVAAPAGRSGRNYTRLLIGCGCLLFLVVFLCAATLWAIDATAPNLLYCGPLRPLFDLPGFTLDCP